MDCYLGVFGHTALDIILQVDKLPVPNTSIAVKNRFTRYGGTGANIAKAAADMDVKTSLASFVGDDFPKEYKRSLKEAGIILKDLKEKSGYQTPTCWIISDPDENQVAVIDQAAMSDASKFDLLNYTIEESEIIHIGTGRPEYYKKVIDRAEKLGKRISFDPAQELKYVYDKDQFRYFLEKCDYFFCNENEFKIALEYLSLDKERDILNFTDNIIVTHGREGSYLFTEEGITKIPAFKPDVVKDPTGAGDAYRAGFFAALNRGFDLEKSCIAASARASFSIEHSGPQEGQIRWEDVMDRLEEYGYGIIN